jgi:hypothetical protein
MTLYEKAVWLIFVVSTGAFLWAWWKYRHNKGL